MTPVDVYHDHIRFLGYHVPLDLSGLPPTAAHSLVSRLQEAADAEAVDEDDIIESGWTDGVKDAGERLTKTLDQLEAEPLSKVRMQRIADVAARALAHIVAENIGHVRGETDLDGLQKTLARWFRHELTQHVEEAAAEGAEHGLKAVRSLAGKLEAGQ
jgi:glutamyl-tRNA reductase